MKGWIEVTLLNRKDFEGSYFFTQQKGIIPVLDYHMQRGVIGTELFPPLYFDTKFYFHVLETYDELKQKIKEAE